MTRINVVPVEELSDQHLIAEYRELPRCIKQNFNLQNAPKNYILGMGHVKWAASHPSFLLDRYCNLCDEMDWRGFQVNYTYTDLALLAAKLGKTFNKYSNYEIKEKDIELNKNRLIEKYRLKPDFYKWTNRKKPKYY